MSVGCSVRSCSVDYSLPLGSFSFKTTRTKVLTIFAVNWHCPTGEGPMPCHTASERSPSCTVWGKASPTQLPLAGMQTPSSCSHPGLQKFQRSRWLRVHTYRLLQEPSRFRRRNGAFSVRVVKYWNRLPALLVMPPSVSVFKKTVEPSVSRNVSFSACVISVPQHYGDPSLFMFPLSPNSDQFMWSLLVLVANPTIKKYINMKPGLKC